jgi:hypothetical protein
MKTKIGLFGSCQIVNTCNFFLNEQVLSNNNMQIVFSLPFFYYDPEYTDHYVDELNYDIFNDIDILIIENNKLNNTASSRNILAYCKNSNIKIIKTCLLKFPIYPINWSGYGYNKNDFLNNKDINKINFKEKFDYCISSLEKNILQSDLNIKLIDFIKFNYNKSLLFSHSLHPTNILLFELWKYIFQNLHINIYLYNYIFDKELIDCWFNPFTTKMITDLNIGFEVTIDDNFYTNLIENDNLKFVK